MAAVISLTRMAVDVLEDMRTKGEDTTDSRVVLKKIKIRWNKSRWATESEKDSLQRLYSIRHEIKSRNKSPAATPVKVPLKKKEATVTAMPVNPVRKRGRPPLNKVKTDVMFDDVIAVKSVIDRIGAAKFQELVEVLA